MNMVFRTFCLVSLTIAVPSIVFAQSNTAFDGTYAGVSNAATGAGASCQPFEAKPQPLMIADGHARLTAGSYASGLVVFEGDVSPQGDFKMWDMFAHNLIGTIDPSGKATGSVNIGDTGCVLTAVWQKQ
jgi:hypothetical protein